MKPKLLTGVASKYANPEPATAFTEGLTGLVLWSGISLLDGSTLIDCIITGLKGGITNTKTGKMLQVLILLHGVDPREAVATGVDDAICGDCKHRAKCTDCGNFGPYPGSCSKCGGKIRRSCYVKIFHGPATTYKVRNGIKGAWPRNPVPYPMATPDQLAAIADLDPVIRFGSYGDPAAVPFRIWESLASVAKGWTGYTHQWRTCDQRLARFLMASVDSPAEYAEARAAGWRTFRVRTKAEELQSGEIVCPASKEGGERVQCVSCKLCQGNTLKAKQIAIVAHGPTASAFRGADNE